MAQPPGSDTRASWQRAYDELIATAAYPSVEAALEARGGAPTE